MNVQDVVGRVYVLMKIGGVLLRTDAVDGVYAIRMAGRLRRLGLGGKIVATDRAMRSIPLAKNWRFFDERILFQQKSLPLSVCDVLFSPDVEVGRTTEAGGNRQG